MKIKMRAWHCYYYLMFGFLLLHGFIYIGGMILIKEFHIELLGLLLVEILLIIGLYGFVKNKPIYKQWFWKIACVVGVIALFYQIYDMQVLGWMGENVVNYLPAIIMFVFLAPWLYGLARYGFSSHDIWSTSP
ncbi:MAG: hypothetical protein KTR20_09755 [Cellvibrionaceae bacterium]|nr:hypothetical protein [Cellvibrionaceae bacterium]